MHKNLCKHLVVFVLMVLCLAACATKITSTVTKPAGNLAEPRRIFVAADITEVFGQSKAESFKETISKGFTACNVNSTVALIPRHSKKLTLENDTSEKDALIKSANEYKPDYILEIRPTQTVRNGAMILTEIIRAQFMIHLANGVDKKPVWSQSMNVQPRDYGDDGVAMAEDVLKELRSSGILKHCASANHD